MKQLFFVFGMVSLISACDSSAPVEAEVEAAREKLFDCIKQEGIKGQFEINIVVSGGQYTETLVPNESVTEAQAKSVNDCAAS